MSDVNIKIVESLDDLTVNVQEQTSVSNVSVVDYSGSTVNVTEIPAEVVVPDPIYITATCDPVEVKNSDLTYDRTIQSGSNLILPDITHTDSDLSPVILPAQTAMVCTPSPVQSGIAYQRPQLTGAVTSYRTGDDYDNQINNPYSVPPTNPLYIQELDYTNANPFLTLKNNNAFGTKDRFTNSLGLTATYDGSNGELADYAIDHLSGIGIWIVLPPTVLLWDDAIDYANASTQNGFTDWRMANIKEIDFLMNTNVAAPLNYNPLLGLGNFGLNYFTSTTRVSNAAQSWYFSSSNGVRSFLNKTSSYKFILIRNHY